MPEGYPTNFNRGALVMHTVGKMTYKAHFLGNYLTKNSKTTNNLTS